MRFLRCPIRCESRRGPLTQLFLKPRGFCGTQRRRQRFGVIDAAKIAPACENRVDHRLQIERNIGIGLDQRNGNRRQGPLEMRRPNLAVRHFVSSCQHERKGTVRPRIHHRHALAAAQQIDFDEVSPSAQKQSLSFAEVKLPSIRSRSLVGRGQHFDARHQTTFAVGFVNLHEPFAKFFLHKCTHGNGCCRFRLGQYRCATRARRFASTCCHAYIRLE